MENSKSVNKGTFLWRLSKKFQFAADKLIPDSFTYFYSFCSGDNFYKDWSCKNGYTLV